MHMERSVDTVLNELQVAIEAYQHALMEYINDKKHRLTQQELDQRIAGFRVNSPFLSNVLSLIKELEASFMDLGIRYKPRKVK